MKYFAYGSNMLTSRLQARTPSARPIGTAVLPGWELRFHKRSKDGSGKATILRTSRTAAAVHGVLFEIEDSETQRLDRAEGSGYLPEEVIVLQENCSTSAMTYVAADQSIDRSLLPTTSYKDLVVAGAREHTLPSDYIHELLAVPSCPNS